MDEFHDERVYGWWGEAVAGWIEEKWLWAFQADGTTQAGRKDRNDGFVGGNSSSFEVRDNVGKISSGPIVQGHECQGL